MGLSLWSNGVPLHSLGAVGDMSFATTWPGPAGGGGGFLTASWSMSLPRSFNHRALRVNAPIELRAGAFVVGRGYMADPDRTQWTFTVDGIMRQGEHYANQSASGTVSSDVSVVVPAAISRGLPWVVVGTLPSGAATADPSQCSSVTDVLNAYCTANGKRWWIDSTSVLHIGTDPTSPAWALTPGTPSMESADDDFYTTVSVRYQSGTDSYGNPIYAVSAPASNSIAATKWGAREIVVDQTSLGAISSAAANAMAASILANYLPRPAFTSSVQPSRGQLANLGGQDVTSAPWLVHAGQMVRHHGWRNLDGVISPGMSLDWVIGGTTWSQSDGLTLTPMGLAPRTAVEVLAQKWAPAQAA